MSNNSEKNLEIKVKGLENKFIQIAYNNSLMKVNTIAKELNISERTVYRRLKTLKTLKRRKQSLIKN